MYTDTKESSDLDLNMDAVSVSNDDPSAKSESTSAALQLHSVLLTNRAEDNGRHPTLEYRKRTANRTCMGKYERRAGAAGGAARRGLARAPAP
ncbi:hypothetical protein EVAR_19965_1 [Eumeta japonica]|uniref:Uncharacterized protein n=1 Tax=Eumeta variegata TaxID=151549 RepID=A0A4C1YGM8_EUMVA|nr:hypothetical protein EVAR_19965_1 [Eumeta japonica]